ncbi:MAG: hypothetical protein QM621_07845 [Aeromicrobium sp.]|uniref:hypothetical protein n=1 Tax=Aeromicrobium sp. TaxID=1871063 RepID=UPI0039E72B4F
MDTLVGVVGAILLLAVLGAVVYGLTMLKDAAVDTVAGAAAGAINRRVRSDVHAEGLAMAENLLFYNVDATDEAIITALSQSVTSTVGPPRVSFGGLDATYLVGVETNRVYFAHGTRSTTSFTATAAIVAANGVDGIARRGVVLSFQDLTTADGVIAEVSAMRALRHDARAALGALDSDVSEMFISS